MGANILEKTLQRSLRDLYDAEQQVLRAASALCGSASDARLADSLARIEHDSNAQLERLDAVFATLYERPVGEPCWPVAAMLREAEQVAAAGPAPATDAVIATAMLAVKRHEITRYEQLIATSIHCGLFEIIPLLSRSLAEEIVAADALAALAFAIDPTDREMAQLASGAKGLRLSQRSLSN